MKPKRNLCPHCLKPPARCLCDYIVPTPNKVFALILQHPNEGGHPKNTGELLHRSLRNSELQVGESFTPASLGACLDNAVLLYPGETEEQLEKLTPPEQPSTLIILDATWRKSRKMLHLNPQLARLPRVSLTDPRTSTYRIRSAEHQHQLSTLEASCYALQQLEQNPDRYQPLLDAFAQYMDKLVTFDPNRR
ncbi:tRNA-uridine aminocarboxypropyltransferase [Gilvimarinus xylanilyticus]|uniref:tRNA-uridine aminocarboxypropyltransferase n=1 Tax=Gilvimarinus xylanilyticus TaxID=2944139 RepID=UPI00300DEFAA